MKSLIHSFLISLTLAAMTATAAPISWGQLQALPLPAPVAHLAYGPLPMQFGELRIPKGQAPSKGFPVVVLIHGGCWLNAFDYLYFTRLAAALTDAGIATWTIEYRRIGDEGGGWPNTFLDVAAATDHLRTLAKSNALDLHRVVTSGHSAGGHLALWLAARPKLAKTSALFTAGKPLPIKAVVGLAAITDLMTYRVGEPGSCNSSVDQLMGGTPETEPQRYADASPMQLLPLGVPQWLVQGEVDPIVSVYDAARYVNAATSAGDKALLITDAEAGHFDLAAPASPIGLQAVAAIKTALGIAKH